VDSPGFLSIPQDSCGNLWGTEKYCQGGGNKERGNRGNDREEGGNEDNQERGNDERKRGEMTRGGMANDEKRKGQTTRGREGK